MSAIFAAQHPGRCSNCSQAFGSGDRVYFTADDTLMGAECCDGVEVDESGSSSTSRVSTITVMPRNKTIKDRCSRCFQIPASNNVCGCD